MTDPLTRAARAFPSGGTIPDTVTDALRDAYVRGWNDAIGGINREPARPSTPADPAPAGPTHVMTGRRSVEGHTVIVCSCGQTLWESRWEAHART